MRLVQVVAHQGGDDVVRVDHADVGTIGEVETTISRYSDACEGGREKVNSGVVAT